MEMIILIRFVEWGIVSEKTLNTLLIELNEKEESSLFFDTTKVSLDCTKW